MSTGTVLTRKTTCPNCGGTGWKVGGGPEAAASRCDCIHDERVRKLLVDSGIPPRYLNCTFESFDTHPYPGAPQSLQQAHLLARNFSESYPAEKRGVLLLGSCGAGKTHLVVATLLRLLERGFACRFVDHRELLKNIQRTFDPTTSLSEAKIIDPLLDIEILAIDDLGVGRATEWAQETLHYLLNHRYTHNRTTLLTTNLQDEEGQAVRLGDGSRYESHRGLAQVIGVRMRSRLHEMCRPVEIRADDYRRIGAETHD